MPESCPRASIIGTGISLPPKVLTNHDIAKMVDTSDEWIRTRTGISERRVVEDGVAASDLALPAAKEALEQAGMSPEELDLIIVASITPDTLMPSTACVLQHKLGAKNAGAFDLSAACSGFIYAIAAGHGFIAAGTAKNVLVVGSECLSKYVDWSDRNTCVLFGDGAGAAILAPSQGRREIIRLHLAADGAGKEMIIIPAGGSTMPASEETVANNQHFMKLKGREVFKFAVTAFQNLLRDAVESCGITEEDVALVVPHQVNFRIIEAAVKNMKIPLEKIYMNLDKYGNTSAASIPIALHEAVKEGRLKSGDILIMVAFGAGLTWGSAVVRW